MTETIYSDARRAIDGLLNAERAGLNPVRLMVVGGSSSEMAGGVIGHNSTYELGEALAKAALDAAREGGFDVAFQCCEHLNRALVMERDAAEARGYECVMSVSADAGLDVGLTLIGMHLRRVAVPVRLPVDHIGRAPIAAARTRPMLVGGERAKYV